MKFLLALLLQFAICVTCCCGEEDFSTRMMRSTVKISHDKSTATGFVLFEDRGDRKFLVTAAHVFDQIPDDVAQVVFRVQEAEAEYKKEPLKLTIRKQGKPIWAKHPTEDIAVIAIEPPAKADLGRIPVSSLATDEKWKRHQLHPGTMISCLGYPHRVEANAAGFALLRNGAIASFPLVPTSKTRTFEYSVNSFEGDSGGPVFLSQAAAANAEPANLILGLITSQRFLDEEAKGIYGSSKIRHRLGISIVVHASLIQETIDRVEK